MEKSQDQSGRQLDELKSDLKKFENEFILRVLSRSFSESEIFSGSRHKACQLIQQTKRQLAQKGESNES